MPTTEELNRKFGLIQDPALSPDNKSEMFDLGTTSFIQAPVGIGEGFLGSEARFQGGDKEVYGNTRFLQNNEFLTYINSAGGLGTPVQAARGAAGAGIDMSLRTIASQFIQFGESVQETEFDGIKDWFLNHNILTPAGLGATVLRPFFADSDMGRKAIEHGKSLLEYNDQVLSELGLSMEEGEDPTLAYNFGAGATSLATALGLTVITKNPKLATVVFSEIAQSDIYLEAIDAGKTPEEAMAAANVGGVVEGALEFVGIGQFMKIIRKGGATDSAMKGIFFSVMGGTATESVQEAAQGISRAAVLDQFDIKESKLDEVLRNAATDAFFGGLLGGTAAGGHSALRSRMTKEILDDPEKQRILGGALLSDITDNFEIEEQIDRDTFSEKVSTMLGGERVTTRELFQNIFKSFAKTGKTDEAYISDEQRDAQIDDAKSQRAESRREKTQVVIEEGRREALEGERLALNERLATLGTEGDVFTTDFLSDFKDADIGAEIILSEDEELTGFITEEMGTDKLERALTNKRGFKRIQRESEEVSNRIDEIDTELGHIEANEGQALTPAGSTISVKAGVLRKTDVDVMREFSQGVKAGRKASDEQRLAMQRIVEETIGKLDIDDASKVRLSHRIKNIKSDATFAREVRNITRRAVGIKVGSVRRQTKKTILTDIRVGLKKNTEAKGDIPIDVVNMFKGMKKAVVGNKEQRDSYIEKRKRILHESKMTHDGILTPFGELELRYHEIMGKANPDLLELEQLSRDIKGTLAVGRAHVSERDQARDAALKVFKDEIAKGAVTQDAVESLIRKKKHLITTPLSYMSETLNTVLTRLGSTLNVTNHDLAKKREIDNRSQEFQDSIAEIDDLSVHDLAEWGNPKGELFETTYTVPAHKEGTVEVPAREVVVRWTKGQMIYQHMLMQNKALREGAMDPNGEMGYTQEFIDEIQTWIEASPDSKQTFEFIDVMFDMFERSFDRLNAVHIRMTGRPLNKVENYIPVSRETLSNDEISMFENIADFDKIADSFTKSRTGSRSKFKDLDILDVTSTYVHNSEHLIAYAEIVRDLNLIFNDPAVRKRISSEFGNSMNDNIARHVQSLNNQSVRNQFIELGIVEVARKNFMYSALALKPQIGFKQITSMFGFAQNMPTKAFIAGVAKYLASPKKSSAILREHSTIGRRGEHFDNELDRLTGGKRLGFFGEKTPFRDFMMWPIRKGDAMAIHMGGFAMYDYLTTKKGISHTDALARVADLAERSQQSTLPSNMTLMQKSDRPFDRMLTMFTSSPIAMINMQYQAIANWKNGKISKTQMFRTIGIYQFIIPSFFMMAARGFDAPDDEGELIHPLVIGPWSGFPIFGDGLDHISRVFVNAATDGELPVYPDRGVMIPAAVEMNDFFEGISGVMSGLRDGDLTLVEFIEHMAMALDGLTEVPLETAINGFEGLGDMFDGDEGKGLLRIAGFTERTAEEATED